MEQYKVITITYKNVSLSELGNYIIPRESDNDSFGNKLKSLKEQFQLNELLYILTCNRVTYFFVNEEKLDQDFLKRFFSFINPALDADHLDILPDITTTFESDAAVKHLMQVAGSLDSMVLGEREIPKQIRLAYEECTALGLTGDNIRVAVKTAIQTAKKIFTDTRISHKPVSVVSLAAEQLLKHHIGKDSRVLIIGAGLTNNMMSKYLLKYGYKNFAVFNRTLENAKILAGKLNGSAHTLAELAEYPQPFDVIISCTGSTTPIVSEELYKKMLKGDESRKVIIDLAVPYDIDRAVAKDFNVDYIEIEKLRAIANENLEFRKGEMEVAIEIIDKDYEEFVMLHKQRQVELAMRNVSDKIKEIKDYAINSVFWKDIEQMDPKSKETLEKVLKYVEKKYVSIPMTVAKEAFAKE